MKGNFNYKKSALIASLGNIIEWYDFAIFGYFSPIISHIFFPKSVWIVGLIKSFLIFTFGYFVRPIGGVIFGYIGDKYGRKIALSISFITMGLATFLMGLLPGYYRFGIISVLMLCFLRIIQGLSAGGELIGTSTYIYEIVPDRSSGFWTSLNTTTSIAGVLLGAIVAALSYHFFNSKFLFDYGWRLAFCLGIFLIIPSLFLIQYLTNENHIRDEKLKCKDHLCSLFKNYHLSITSVILINILMSVGFYVVFLWLPAYLGGEGKTHLSNIIGVNSIAISFLIILIPLFGRFSDRVGSIKLAIIAALLIFSLAYPLFYVFSLENNFLFFICQITFCLILCSIEATMPKIIAQQFSAQSRYSGGAIGYNISTSFFGGTAPLLCTLLVAKTHSLVSIGLYIMFCALLSIGGYTLILYNMKKVNI
ncbi:MAG: MFS transporter [Gammaproteobacteria bacterium]|jgi:MHS family proline/betaine transporter-like MFS transporter